ncbi:hypothetical protein, partial [Jannaschia aquimarina]|uniref:hypothetical protein n=1 Tax=Jannaschia aquimarina TaxID=935700 RepID=UPI0005C49854
MGGETRVTTAVARPAILPPPDPAVKRPADDLTKGVWWACRDLVRTLDALARSSITLSLGSTAE